jgi:N-acyl-D-amino-acid deacylase
MTQPRRTLIRGGLVADGTGAPAVRGDVLLDGARIVGILPVDAGPFAATEIDATGLLVAPGFIDVHQHADFTLLAFPDADSAIRQGVTTIVNGNCGGGAAPIEPGRDFRSVAFAYDPDWGIDVRWRSFGDYLQRVSAAAVNVATLVPHGVLRNAVMGLEARAATRSERRRMAALLDDALDAGAVGMSTGLEYQPGCNADVGEISELARVVARHDGVYATHIRNRAEGYADATREAIEIARRGPVRLQLSHFAPRPYAPPEQTQAAFAAVDDLAREGHPVWVDSFPEVWGPGLLLDLFPRDVFRGSPREIVRRLRHPRTRAHVADWFSRGENFLVRAGGYERIFLASNPGRPEHNGRSLVELAEAAEQTVADFCCNTIVDAGEVFPALVIRHVYATEGDLRDVLCMPYCSLGSDGVVTSGEDDACRYPWNASTYGYAARTLGHYVRDVGLYELEDAVRRLAALPAEAMGLSDRGTLAPGKAADVVALDPTRVTDRTTPVHMARYPDGIEYVLIGGVPVVEHGRGTGARPGEVVGSRA